MLFGDGRAQLRRLAVEQRDMIAPVAIGLASRQPEAHRYGAGLRTATIYNRILAAVHDVNISRTPADFNALRAQYFDMAPP
jgi:hypothetical protein